MIDGLEWLVIPFLLEVVLAYAYLLDADHGATRR
jgi:hypothetical protein